MSNIDVDPEQLKTAATKLRLAIDYADKAAAHSKEADPDWRMWGIAGVAFAPVYFTLADGWRSWMEKTGQAIEGYCCRLDGTSGTYEDIDSVLSADFGAIATQLDDAVGDYVSNTRTAGPRR